MKLAILAFAILLTGCATTAPTPVNPFTSPTIESERARCLSAKLAWFETQDRYICLSPDMFQRERT